MAGLALGVVGGVLGNFLVPGIGGSIGFMIGSAIGNSLEQTKQQGPRLADLKLQNSEYGQMRPILFGTDRATGVVIWQTDLEEHSHGGGKGGSAPETFTYTASYAIRLCDGPIIGIDRIFADGRLVYDGTQTYANWPMTVYLGTETQLPDPTMEAVLGVGNVNANRGVAYAVWKDHDLSDFFNRIPNLSFEIVASGSGVLRRISTWSVPEAPTYTGVGVIYVAGWYMVAGVLTHSEYTEDSPTSSYQETTYNINTGALISTLPAIDVVNPNDASLTTWRPSPNSNVAAGIQRGAGSVGVARWYVAGVTNGVDLRPPVGADDFKAVSSLPFVYGDFVYAAGDNAINTVCFIGKWGFNVDHSAVSGTPENEYLDLQALGYTSGANVGLTFDNEGYLWAGIDLGLGVSRLLKINATTMTLISDTAGPPALSHSCGLATFTVFRGFILVGSASVSDDEARLWSIDGGGSYTLLSTVPAAHGPSGAWPFSSLGGGYVITHDGILFIAAQEILANIVSALSVRAGLTTSQIDVTELVDEVDGYAIGNQAPARNSIQPLQAGFFFDGTESDGKIKFPKRGRASSATILQADLGTRQTGAELQAPIAMKRTQEVELPRRVFVNYVDRDTDYQKGTQIAQRLVTSSQLEWTFDLPIVMTSQKAIAVANTLLYMSWLQREQLSYATPMKWCMSDPNDVNTVDGNVLRLTDRSTTLDGVVKFNAVRSFAQLYEQAPVPPTNPGFVPQVPPTNQLTNLLMLDIPLVQDADFPNGPYAAMAGATSPSWRGANLYKSSDGGSTYPLQLTTSDPSTMGASVGALGNFYSGNIFDELNSVDVIIGPGGGTLASMTELAILNGANEFLLGYEILRPKNAVLIATDTYTLSGFIRGCRGTEWAMGTHVAGERFVVLPVNNVNEAFSEIGVSEKFKAVTFGQALASTAAEDFTNTGVALQCYTPVHLGGGLDGADDATLTWTRRTRIGGAWLNGTDVPLSEPTEQYVVQIWDVSYAICARIILVSNVQSAAYSLADQITDFGAAQAHIYFTVGQIGSLGLGGQSRGVIAGSGGSDNAPLVPIAPYVSSPAVPPPGPTNPVNLVMQWDGSNSPQRPVSNRIGETLVVEFTTDANPYGQTKINAAEYGNPAYLRWAVLATDTGGVNILTAFDGQSAQQYGNQVGFIFGPTNQPLLAFTTYYFIIRDQLPNGLPSGTIGDPANMAIEF